MCRKGVVDSYDQHDERQSFDDGLDMNREHFWPEFITLYVEAGINQPLSFCLFAILLFDSFFKPPLLPLILCSTNHDEREFFFKKTKNQ